MLNDNFLLVICSTCLKKMTLTDKAETKEADESEKTKDGCSRCVNYDNFQGSPLYPYNN